MYWYVLTHTTMYLTMILQYIVEYTCLVAKTSTYQYVLVLTHILALLINSTEAGNLLQGNGQVLTTYGCGHSDVASHTRVV